MLSHCCHTLSIWLRAVDLGSEEMRLEYTRIYEEYQALFESGNSSAEAPTKYRANFSESIRSCVVLLCGTC
jgi:hypothetical protein